MPSITISASPSDISDKVVWHTNGLDGIQTLALMAETIFDMYAELFDAPGRPYFEGSESRVCIEYDGENVSIAYRPEANVKQAQGLVTAALAALCKRAREKDFDPLEGVLGAIMMPISQTLDSKRVIKS